MPLRTKDGQQPPEPGERPGTVSHSEPQKETTLPTLGLWAPGLLNRERRHFCYLKAPCVVLCCGTPRKLTHPGAEPAPGLPQAPP